MLVITDDACRADIEEALTHLSHRARRVHRHPHAAGAVGPDHATIHAEINELLTARDTTP